MSDYGFDAGCGVVFGLRVWYWKWVRWLGAEELRGLWNDTRLDD